MLSQQDSDGYPFRVDEIRLTFNQFQGCWDQFNVKVIIYPLVMID